MNRTILTDTPQGFATLPSGLESDGKSFLTPLDSRPTDRLSARKGEERKLASKAANFVLDNPKILDKARDEIV